MMASHAVQTSTEALASVFRSRNPEVMAFSNAAFTLPPFPARRPGMPRIFFGAANREKISAAVARSLEPLLKKYPKVMFEVVHDRAFFEALPTRAKTFSPTLPYDDYLAAMARCDIALLPLEGTEGEGFKSDLKWVEAASRGLAVVASPCVYAESIRDGETGLIAESVADWAPALGRLIASPPLRRSIAQSAWQEVQAQRMFAYQANARRDWYLSLWARRAEIEADLLRRVPQLAQALGR
jgi:glycosyltransferase involved in cell wall biosynthesis